MRYLRVIWIVFLMHLKQMAVDGFVLFVVFVQPLLVALLAIYMLRDTAGFQALFVIVGSGLTGLWSGTLFFCSRNIDRERWSGTLEGIIGSPSHLATVLFAKSLANVTLSIGSMVLSYPLAALIFGLPLTIAQPFLFAVSLLLAIVAMVSLGMLITPLMTIHPGIQAWSNAFEFPVYMAGGFLFPIALLPGWTTPISYALSPYWAARALHNTSGGGGSLEDVFLSWMFLIASALVYWIISIWLFRVVLHRAREEATLGLE